MTTCTVKNGVVEDFSNISLSGVCARVFVDGKSWGFSSTNMLDSESVEQTLENALKLAKASLELKEAKFVLPPVKKRVVSIWPPSRR